MSPRRVAAPAARRGMEGQEVMNMQLVEESWLLWKRFGFRDMVALHPDGPKSPELRRLWRLREMARRRYFRRKKAMGGEW